jgi:RNA polymerase sigma factor (sigma-70 family)
MTFPFDSTVSEPAERDPSSPDILRLLVDNHARFLGFLERRVGSRDEAEDILQEAFVRSIGRTDALQTPESATAWFYRVLRNAIIDHHRRDGTRSRAFLQLAREVEGQTAPADQELEAFVCACVTALVDTLKPEYATALRRVDLGRPQCPRLRRGGGDHAG